MKTIKYPIEVSAIKYGKLKPYEPKGFSAKCGDFVAIRPCADKFNNKTYLGIFLGEISLGAAIYHNPETKELEVLQHLNPAIYVPEFKEIVFGCGSWWHKLEKPEDLEQITDKDIGNVWYVKALKELDKNHNSNMESEDDK